MQEKRCKGPCGQVKPLDQFPPHKHAIDGRMRTCRDCGERYGLTARSKKRQQIASALPPRPAPAVHAAPLPASATPAITPLFVQAGAYRFGLSSIALVDTRQPGHVELRLNIHEVNGKGIPEALSFAFDGAEAALLLAALDGVTGRADAEVETLRETIRQLEGERDTALQLAAELEQKQKSLRAALGV